MIRITTLTVSVVGIVWVLICLKLRESNFDKRGKRRQDRHKADGERRVEVIRYHNEAVYRAFEFYFKVTLAVLGGIAYVALMGNVPSNSPATALLSTSQWILWGAAAVFSSVIVMHQKSKIERWKVRFDWWEPILWIEFPLIAIMYVIAAGVQFQLLPQLLP